MQRLEVLFTLRLQLNQQLSQIYILTKLNMDQNEFAEQSLHDNNPEQTHHQPSDTHNEGQKQIQENGVQNQNQQIKQNQEHISQNKLNQEIRNQQHQEQGHQDRQEDNDGEVEVEVENYRQDQNQQNNQYQGQVFENQSKSFNNQQQQINHKSNQVKLPKIQQYEAQQEHTQQKKQHSNQKNENNQFSHSHNSQKKVQNKLSQRSQSFKWGEDQQQNKQQQKKKRSYSQFFINNKLEKYNDLFKSKQNKLEKNDSINTKRGEQNKKEDIDIWQDLRNSMVQKSRVSNKTKSKKLEINRDKKANKKNGLEDELSKSIKYSTPNNKKKSDNKKSILKLSKQQNNKIVESIDDMNRLILQKVQKWKRENRQIERRRLEFIQSQQQKIKNQHIYQTEKAKNKNQEKKQIRVKAIQQRLEQKEKKKRKITTSPNKQDSKKGSKNKAKKSKSQKNYKQIQQSKNQESPKIKQVEPQEFSIHWKRKNNDILQEKQKLLRRKIFQQKIRQIPVNISSDKKLKLLIQIDKSQNPLKYQFLQKKGLEDEQIYKNKNQFKLPDSPKRIGIQYLQDLREKSKLDDLRRYMSQQSLVNIKKYERDWKSPNLQKQYKIQSQGQKLPALFNPQSVEYKKRKLHEQDNQYLSSIKK